MRWRGLLASAAGLFVTLGAQAHLNSPDIYLEEAAGPWPAITVIVMPSAIPGEARVEVRLTDLRPDESVRVRFLEIPPNGESAAPGWVGAKRSSSEANLFVAPMPLMAHGVWTARIEVSGARGSGTLEVPVAAKSPPSRAMNLTLGLILAGLTLFLLGSLWVIVRILATDVYRDPRPSSSRKALAWPAGAAGAFLFVLGFHMAAWWHLNTLLALRTARATRAELWAEGPVVAGSAAELRLRVLDGKGNPVRDVIPDHGKIMHAVVVRVPDLTYFLHVHPQLLEPGEFSFAIVAPSPGTYRVFADILHAAGVAETVTADLTVAPGSSSRATAFTDPDDSDSVQAALGEETLSDTRHDVGDGLSMRLVSPGSRPVGARQLLDLGFELDGPDGRPVAALEPYMGMAGHLLILRDDLDVFAHVHPMGTVSGRMAMPGAHASMTPEEHARQMALMLVRVEGARVSFPYGFPGAGRYRLFVQMKYAGRVRTGVFDLDVAG